MLAVAAIVVGGTYAYFSDTETSTGNTFTAGSIDLRVASQCHYFQDNGAGYSDIGCGAGAGFGNWALTDLGAGVNQFFTFADVKPGDYGEDTVKIQVDNNDAWGQMTLAVTSDVDNTCTEPELVDEIACGTDGTGELREATLFSLWLDQGAIAGFQNTSLSSAADPTEGDNIMQTATEPLLSGVLPVNYVGGAVANVSDGVLLNSQSFDLSDALSAAYTGAGICTDTDGNTVGATDPCRGLATDGRIVTGVYYSFGVAWQIPTSTGNPVQTDSFAGDMTFNVTQHRNQANPY